MLSPTCLGKVAVAAAGTPVQIVSTQTRCARIQFSVPASNAGSVYVGNSAVNHSTLAGVIRELVKTAAGAIDDQYTIASEDGSNVLNAADYWIDVATNGDALLVTYWQGA